MLIRRKQLNNQPEQNEEQRLHNAKKDMLIKGSLVAFTVVVTVVLVFAMTAAWFTNVVSTGPLTFQVESWGFDGDVEVTQDIIKAAPGDSGYLSMKITSVGEKDSKLSVGISKEFMQDVQLQQRIFFYADTSSVVNGERVDKVYLTNTTAYPYYLPAQNQLILSEQIYTDVRLKWEWVYDVVGYYFRGTPNGSSFEVEEYLRPIEYNYDYAQFDTTGNLIKVDANTSVLEYLAELSAKDGYAGAYSVGVDENTGKKVLMQDGEKVTATLGCYPIDPDNHIWLYLCSQQEIQKNTAWDTQYGMAGLEIQKIFQVRLTVIGQQFDPQILPVADASSLKDAIAAGDGQTITLQHDIVLTEQLQLPKGSQTVLDLNGHTLTCATAKIFSVPEDAKLTLLNGTVSGNSGNTSAVYTMGGQVTLSKMNIENVYYGVNVEDYRTSDPNGANAFIRILDSNISAKTAGVMLNGDGTASAERTVLVVQNSTISSDYFGITGNGTITGTGRYGTDIQILDSDVSGFYTGIYHPQMQSTLTVTRSTITGWTGMAIKGGDVIVADSIVHGTATDEEAVEPDANKLSASGFTDTGDGIYVEASYNYPITVTVSGDSVVTRTAQKAQAVRAFPASTLVEISLNAGTYDTDVSAYLQPGFVCTQTEGKYIVTPQ